MKSPLPEIKIAFIGNKSSGKTTLVNALLRGNYSDAAKDRSKDGINSFRVVIEAETSESCSNVIADKSNAIKASAVTTDVKVQDALFDTHTDTNLVLIDVPTINTRNAQNFYLQYVNTQWESFDCVVVVLNGGKEFLDQLDFLHLIKANLTTKKEIPILFVINKVDAILLHHCALAHNFEQLRKLIKSIFMTSSKFLKNSSLILSLRSVSQVLRRSYSFVGRFRVHLSMRCWINF
jgi:GTPase Era involved in 16S rRNA processing